MRVIDDLEDILETQGTVSAFGMFDGLHIGHQVVIERLVKKSKFFNLASVVISFESHPLQFLKPDQSPPLLTPPKKKLELLSQMDVDIVLLLKFGADISELSAGQFVKKVLIDKLKSKAVVVGYDCAFGKNRSGNFQSLKQLADKYNFLAEVVPPQRFGPIIAHSTLIRKSISEGDMELAEALLGRKYSILGKVVAGKGEGKKLGYPTANIEVENQPLPPPGVYAIQATVNNRTFDAVLNMGWQPTLGENSFKVEVHLLDFNQDIYGSEIEATFFKKLRDEKRFESVDKLCGQIQNDIIAAKKALILDGVQLSAISIN